MKNKDKIKFLLREGLSLQTVSNLNEAQLDVLTKKFKKGKKEESKEQTQVVTQIYDTKKPEEVAKLNQALKNPASLQGQNIQVKETEMTEDNVTVAGSSTAGSTTQAAHQVMAPDNMDDDSDTAIDKEEDVTTESTLKERFESKAQQNFFWAKCNTSKGVKKKKWCEMAREFSDSTSKKQYDKMPEKLHPEKTVKYKKEKTNENLEKFLENKIISVLESKVKPRMKKSDLVKLVQEKSESMILRKPKKVTMFSDEAPKMKTPIAKLFSIGKTKK